MIIVNLKGGLGNQMFQYAAAKRLAVRHNVELKLDLSFLEKTNHPDHITRREFELSEFRIEASIATKTEVLYRKNLITRFLDKYGSGIVKGAYVQEKNFHFDPAILELGPDCYLEGHWMTDLYFRDIASTIRSQFKLKENVGPEFLPLIDKMKRSSSVCIQIRRGDYVSNPVVSQRHGTTTVDYFNHGVKYIQERISDPVFFIFSDDPDWCKQNLKHEGEMHFVEKELVNENVTSASLLSLMTFCKHFVISNSTFGWWGAWLSENNNKLVVVPERWFNDKNIDTSDIYLSDWIKL